jgi:hypothetical protein
MLILLCRKKSNFVRRGGIMQKKLRNFIVLVIVLFASLSINLVDAGAATVRVGDGLYIKKGVTIEIGGKKVQFSDPILNKSGQLLLPMRDFYEAIGAKVSWSKKALTASASRNGKTVDLIINSKTAKVSGKQVTMNIAPLMYKYRTYVPLRFVSENLDGRVIWNQKQQTVEITLGESTDDESNPPPQTDSFILHMNNKRIVMNEPVIIKGGRTYIPANYFYENLENSSGNWLSEQDFELQIAGLNFVFTKGSNNVLVNQEQTLITEKPFIQSGEMYVPVHFIVNALGGNLRLISSKNEIYIYLYHYMFTSDFIEKQQGATARPNFTLNAAPEGNRHLLVSDNPETLTPSLVPGTEATLSSHEMESAASLNEHRVFGWHLNRLGKKVSIGITIQNKSDTTSIEVSNSKGYVKKSGNSWINYDIGLPIADAVLNDKLNVSENQGIIIKPGETKVIEKYELYPGYIIGFLQDIDIKSVDGTNSSYTIRTVLSKDDGDLTKIQSEPVPIDRTAAHPRGVWPFSTILTEFPAYTVDSPEIGYNISNGQTDHLQTEENSLSKINGAVGNPGHFGIVYRVNIPIINPTGEPKVIKLKLAGRGGLYSGAIKMNGKVHLVPTLKAGTEYIELPEYTVQGQSDVISLEIMHAGGASLPAAIYVDSN